MHNPFSRNRRSATSLRIGLGTTHIALLKYQAPQRGRGSIAADCCLPASEAASPDALANQLGRILAETGSTDHPATIVLADQRVRLFMVTPAHNTGSLQDCQAAASMRFQQLYGEPISSWQLQADWQARQPFLACAVPRALLAPLEQVARQYRLTLVSVVPQFVAAWNRWHPSLSNRSWFGVRHDQSLTLAAIEHNSLCAVKTMQLAPGAWQDPGWLSAHLTREALRLNLALPEKLQLCGMASDLAAATAGLPPGCTQLDAALMATDERPVSPAVWLARTGARA